MKKLIVGFSRPKGKLFPCFSWGIRLFQGWTQYSHVYLKFKSSSLSRDIIYQASGLQVNFIGKKMFYDHVHVIKEFELELTDADYIQMMKFFIDNAGKPYSIKDIIAILFNKPNLSDGNDSFICSELVALVLNRYIGISFNKPLGLLSPKDVYKIINTYVSEIVND